MSDHPQQQQKHDAEQGHDFAAANKEHFDKHAHNLEEMHPKWVEMCRKEVEALRTQWPALFDKESTTVLDFACGIGTYVS